MASFMDSCIKQSRTCYWSKTTIISHDDNCVIHFSIIMKIPNTTHTACYWAKHTIIIISYKSHKVDADIPHNILLLVSASPDRRIIANSYMIDLGIPNLYPVYNHLHPSITPYCCIGRREIIKLSGCWFGIRAQNIVIVSCGTETSNSNNAHTVISIYGSTGRININSIRPTRRH